MPPIRRSIRTAVLVLFASALLVFGSRHLTSLGSFAADRHSEMGPRAVVAHFEQDLGELTQGEVREVCFLVHNAGRRRLVLTGEDRPCCGRSDGPSSHMAMPGDSVVVRAEVDTSRWFGRLREEFSYRTNDPRQPRLTFTVIGDVAIPARDGDRL